MRPKRSRGAYALVRTGRTQEAIAKQLGVSRVAVQKWMSGNGNPRMPMRYALRDVYHIPVEAWDQESGTKRDDDLPPDETVMAVADALSACAALAKSATATAEALRRLAPSLEGSDDEEDEDE